MTSLKASLSVILKANDIVVAEIEDAKMWQDILSVINGTKRNIFEPDATLSPPPGAPRGGLGSRILPMQHRGTVTPTGDHNVDAFAAELSVDPAILLGALSPSDDAPFLTLDVHCWEEMKSSLGDRGKNAVAAIVVGATLLALWFRQTGTPHLTQKHILDVLGTINVADRNPGRGLDNAQWLNRRPGGNVVLNPAQISKAKLFATSFCSKDWTAWKQQAVTP